MNRFATFLRFAIILVVAIACGMLTTLIPSPYGDSGSTSASRVQEASASDSLSQQTAAPTHYGVDVDANRLAFISNFS